MSSAPRIVAFVNFKGGVGKTAAVVNVAAFLAKQHDKRVLVVDLDPQSNASLWLMRPDLWRSHVESGRRSSYQLFRDALAGTRKFAFDEAVVRGVPRREFPLIASLDLLPASVDLLRIEEQMQGGNPQTMLRSLRRALGPHVGSYDYVLLDCPPQLYGLTRNAAFAADAIVVPFVPDYLSLSGLRILAELLDGLAERQKGFRTEHGRAKIAALLVSHYRTVGRVFEHAINESEIALNQLREKGWVHPDATILRPFIRHCVGVAESTNEHVPVLLHKPGSIGAQDYADLTQNLMAHVDRVL